jgi:hypothetical protein
MADGAQRDPDRSQASALADIWLHPLAPARVPWLPRLSAPRYGRNCRARIRPGVIPVTWWNILVIWL